MIRRFINWIISLRKKPEIQTPPTVGVVVASGNRQKFDTDFKFVDSSHYHPEFDATKYPAPIFVNKCTEGVSFIDKTHAIRKRQCADNGILYGGYHFFRCRDSWSKQVDFYLKTHGEFVLPPIVDYETSGHQSEEVLISSVSIDNLYAFMFHLEQKTGMLPIIYLNYSFAKRANFPEKFGRFPAWFARYNSFLGPIPAPWTEKTTFAWQFTESGEFEGLGDKGDVNLYFAKSEVLKARDKE